MTYPEHESNVISDEEYRQALRAFADPSSVGEDGQKEAGENVIGASRVSSDTDSISLRNESR